MYMAIDQTCCKDVFGRMKSCACSGSAMVEGRLMLDKNEGVWSKEKAVRNINILRTLIGCFFFLEEFAKSHQRGYLLAHTLFPNTMDNSMALDYPISKFEADNNLDNQNVVLKYRIAADIANDALIRVLSKVAAGVSVHDLCQYGDDIIQARGIAFPTSVCLNNTVQYHSPLADEPEILMPGDLVKIELGVHLDGYIATAAHTTVLNPDPQKPIMGPQADAICAAHYAAETALRLAKPGVKASTITRAIIETCAIFRCVPIEGTGSHRLKRFVLRATRMIPSTFDDGLTPQQRDEADFTLEQGEAYAIDVVVAAGDGKTKESLYKSTIFQRDVNQSYQLKMKSSRIAFNEISERFGVFPFSIRSLRSAPSRLGVSELVSRGLLTPYATLRTPRTSEPVAQFKCTLLLTPAGALRTTLALPLPYVRSTYRIVEGTEAAKVLGQPEIKMIKEPKLPDVPRDIVFGRKPVGVEVSMDLS
ncbi:peptidase M24, structural domain-containing protein [Endogone sp. FLAS-F59071]|nr:peptidase M24, structural domain-containing protein [Endogone sp. FLAS-F59071]|eukprot:RUS21478.1 peptidase M24, structural domain-containing protein [Endogone sp. FLAS-F59071]